MGFLKDLNKITVSEEVANSKAFKVRLFFPNSMELNQATLKFIDKSFVQCSTMHQRKKKGISISGTVTLDHMSIIQDTQKSFMYDGVYIQNFLMYYPDNHCMQYLAFTQDAGNLMKEEEVMKAWSIKPVYFREISNNHIDTFFKKNGLVLFKKTEKLENVKKDIEENKSEGNVRVYLKEFISEKDYKIIQSKQSINQTSTKKVTSTPNPPTSKPKPKNSEPSAPSGKKVIDVDKNSDSKKSSPASNKIETIEDLEKEIDNVSTQNDNGVFIPLTPLKKLTDSLLSNNEKENSLEKELEKEAAEILDKGKVIEKRVEKESKIIPPSRDNRTSTTTTTTTTTNKNAQKSNNMFL